MPDGQDNELKTRAREFAEGLAKAVADFDLHTQVTSDEPENIRISFEGPDSPMFVGRNGQVLDALQTLASHIINRRSGQRLRITFDADLYRARREETLIKLAQDLADQVKSTGQEAVLDPLSPMERRIVHTALADDPGVQTYSEGEEPDRYIIISPAE